MSLRDNLDALLTKQQDEGWPVILFLNHPSLSTDTRNANYIPAADIADAIGTNLAPPPDERISKFKVQSSKFNARP